MAYVFCFWRKMEILDKPQREAVEKLGNGKILCGGVGSGKSRVALVYFKEKIKAPANLKKLYIITTARKREEHDWDDECKTVGVDLEHVTVDSWNNIKKYTDVVDAFFIFDEQRVVGSGAWVKAFLKIVKSNKWILLSATPGDTWADYIPVFIANGFYKNRTQFLREHAVYSRYSKYPKIDRYTGEKALRRLLEYLLVQIVVERHTVPHRAQRMALYPIPEYKALMKNRWNPYTNEPIKEAGEFFYTMRKMVNSDPSRLEIVRSLIAKHPKMIVFYNFDYELEILRSLEKDGVIVKEWNGHKHEPVPEGDSWVYLVQYTAGAESWNCIETDTIVFYSLNYSYKVLVQSEGRIDRRNTPFTDLYYYTIRSTSKIDLMILQALRAKKNFNEKSWK